MIVFIYYVGCVTDAVVICVSSVVVAPVVACGTIVPNADSWRNRHYDLIVYIFGVIDEVIIVNDVVVGTSL